MKIGILTHPLIGNYGGILQAFALQEVLKASGHTVIILDRRHNLDKCSLLVKSVGKLFGIKRFSNPYWVYSKQQRFIKDNFHRTPELNSQNNLIKKIKDLNVETIIIGSDQVWNLEFAKLNNFDFFGDFLRRVDVNTFSYAASMGQSVIDESEVDKIKDLLKLFSGISVRESQTKELLEARLNISNIKWVLDPTLLHASSFYDKICSPRLVDKPYIFVYWLGDMSLIPDYSAAYPNHKVVFCKLGDPATNLSVEEWLSAIKYADLVVTDSFHGCAFSVIYKKKLIVSCNKSGGWNRINSLFSMFEIVVRFESDNIIDCGNCSDETIDRLRDMSRSYLSDCL